MRDLDPTRKIGDMTGLEFVRLLFTAASKAPRTTSGGFITQQEAVRLTGRSTSTLERMRCARRLGSFEANGSRRPEGAQTEVYLSLDELIREGLLSDRALMNYLEVPV